MVVMYSWEDPEEKGCKGLLGCLETFQTWPFSVPALPVLFLSSWSWDKTELPFTEEPEPALNLLPKLPHHSPYWHPILGITPQACMCSFASPEDPEISVLPSVKVLAWVEGIQALLSCSYHDVWHRPDLGSKVTFLHSSSASKSSSHYKVTFPL